MTKNNNKKIETLTDAQRAKFPEYVRKYTEVGLSCSPADKPRAERGIRAHYAAASIECPTTFVWVSSPIVLSMAAPLAAALLEGGRPVATKSLPRLVDLVLRNVDAAVRAEVVRAVLAAGATTEKGGDGEELADGLRQAIKANWAHHNGGAWWVSFVAWGVFVRDELGCDIPIGPREDTDSSCGWWWPHRQFVMICDRPEELHRDVDGRLHSPSGPAIKWRDGWGLYFWRGTRVPREWIEQPGEIDPRLALSHPNVEQRRCVAEIIGWAKVLDLLQPRVVNADPDPEIGTLLEVEIDGREERFLKVRCGTGRTFVLPVPPDVATAVEANAWTYGLDGMDIRALEART